MAAGEPLDPRDARWVANPPSWVGAVERAYVEAAGSVARPLPYRKWLAASELPVIAGAAAGAVASRFLAVGTPRSIGLIGPASPCAYSLAAHGVWFSPRDIRCHGDVIDGGRAVSLDEALAADIVCVHAPLALSARQLRRGTHVNALALVPVVETGPFRPVRESVVSIDPELAAVAMVVHEYADLPAIVAGHRDGRQLDEITIFVLDGAEVAIAALQSPPP